MEILVTYGSGYGTTKEIAIEIAKILSNDNQHNVKISPIDISMDISSYDAVIIGTSIRADKPLGNVRDFVAQKQDELSSKKIGIFLVCLSAITREGRKRCLTEYLPHIVPETIKYNLVKQEAFPGRIDFDRLNPVMQNLVKYITRNLRVPVRNSVDARNWKHIRKWTYDLKKKLEKT